jgi:glycosyltransferase involved in cell wall biosynthesis
MRVAMVGPYPVDTSRFGGGVETSFFNLLEGLRSFGDVEPHVITFARGAEEATRNESGPAPVLYLPGRKRFNNLTLYRNDRRLLADALAEIGPDIVHAQDAIAYGFVTLKVVKHVPVVVSVHGIVRGELKYLPHRMDKVRTAVARVAVQRYCISHAKFLLQPSRYPEEYFTKEIRGRIFDVGNGISDAFFAAGAMPEPGRLLYVGAITPIKRVLDVVEMFARLRQTAPHARLRIAGPASDAKYGAAVRERIAELGLGAKVELLGSRSPDELVDEYRRAAVLVLASGQENSPMVIGEAMAVGVPVVATRVGGVRYLVEDGVSGYLADVGDVDTLAARVSELLLDDARRTDFGAEARASAARRFRSVDVAGRVRDVYLEALQEFRRS